MLKRVVAFSVVTISLIIVSTYFNRSISYTQGPPAASTGSPGDGGTTCNTSGCHTGLAVMPQAGWITSNVPPTGYIPGNTYTVTLTATAGGINKFGFQASPQDVAGALVGTIMVTNATETQLAGSNKYIQHTANGVSGSGSKTWNFDWQAPSGISDSLTIYAAFNCADGVGVGGDQIHTSTLKLYQDMGSTGISGASITQFKLLPMEGKRIKVEGLTADVQYNLMDLQGKVMQAEKVTPEILQLPSNTPAGIYFVQFFGPKVQMAEKVFLY